MSIFFKNKNQLIIYAVTTLCVLYFIHGYMAGERILYNNGLGYDGFMYSYMAQKALPNALFNNNFNPYFYQRILPSLIVSSAAKIFHLSIATPSKVIHAFYLYNSLLLILGIILFLRLGKKLQWSSPIKTLSVAMLVFIFPVMKNSIYNPTLTDMTAFFLGIATLYCYLSQHYRMMILVTFLSAFTFPSMLIAALPFFLFPRKNIEYCYPKVLPKINSLALLCATSFILLVIFLLFKNTVHLRNDVNQINQSLLPLSMLMMFIYLYFMGYYLFQGKAILQALRPSFSLKGFLSYILLFILVKLIIHKFSNNEIAVLTSSNYLALISLSSLVNPLTSLVSHIMKFGPAVILCIFFWPLIARTAYRHGLGVVGFLCFYMLISIGPESRQFINAWPVFVFLLSEVHQQKNISWRYCHIVSIISIILTRLWLPMNVGPLDGNLLSFPMQMFFMNSGPWMSTLMYNVFVMIIIITSICLYLLQKNEGLG